MASPDPRVVIVESKIEGIADGWFYVGQLTEAVPLLSSMSSEPPGEAREVILFGWADGQAGVWRSVGGLDVEVGEVREVLPLGLEQLSMLDEPFEYTQHVPDSPFPVRQVRLRMLAEGTR